MALCLPLQGALAVTMQMGMAAPVTTAITTAIPTAMTSAHGSHAMQNGAKNAMHEAIQQAHGMHDMQAPADAAAAQALPCHDADVANAGDVWNAAAHANAAPAAPGHLAAPADHSTDSHHGCSFCAQCCIGVALLVMPLTVAAPPLADTIPAAVPAALLERQPATPDRPPKLSLA